MTVNPVNDAPALTLVDNDLSSFSDTNIVFEDLLNMKISVSDVDNENSELNFYASFPDENVNGVYGESAESAYVTLVFTASYILA